MKHLSVFFFFATFLLFVSGCASTQQVTVPADQPELVSMTSLPPISSLFPASGLKFKMLFHVKHDGTVMEVKMMNSSGDPNWDKGAADSMARWQFSAFPASDTSPDKWIRNTVVLQVQEPTILTLGVLIASSQQAADSVYGTLKAGADFDALIRQVPPGATQPQGRFIGAIDIARYPKVARDALRRLGINDFTGPIRVGFVYLIYKRYQPDGLEDPPQQ